jgi:hypothetical protein
MEIYKACVENGGSGKKKQEKGYCLLLSCIFPRPAPSLFFIQNAIM